MPFWTEKSECNVLRDRRKEAALREMGWQVIVVWECEAKDATALATTLEVVRYDEADLSRSSVGS